MCVRDEESGYTTKRGSSIIAEMAAAVKAEGVVCIYCWPRVFTELRGGWEALWGVYRVF
jgi:hypothetical protein